MVKKKHKYSQNPVVTTRNSQVRDAFYAATDQAASLDAGQIATGTIQHPDTGCWQVWLSTNGYDITSIAAFREESKAAEAVEIIKKEEREGNLAKQAVVDALFAYLRKQSDEDVHALPDETVRQLARSIAHKNKGED